MFLDIAVKFLVSSWNIAVVRTVSSHYVCCSNACIDTTAYFCCHVSNHGSGTKATGTKCYASATMCGYLTTGCTGSSKCGMQATTTIFAAPVATATVRV